MGEGTSTESFGSSGRENHDSSRFYAQAVYEELNQGNDEAEYREQDLRDDLINSIRCRDSRDMSVLPDESVHLMVTSPPYLAAKEYDRDWTLDEYCGLLKNVLSETYRVLVSGGRACVNIANIGRSPYLPLHSFIIEQMLELGFLMRGEIIWDKGPSVGSSTAWGSWCTASNPTLRDVHEYILVFSKETFSRELAGRESTIDKESFLENTKSIWRLQTASAEEAEHPAPFPVELPRRLIELYTASDDVVLDPFVGSGTTAVAARENERCYVGFDNSETYVQRARRRLDGESVDSEA